jgi:hypothetical protein
MAGFNADANVRQKKLSLFSVAEPIFLLVHVGSHGVMLGFPMLAML